jgi:glycosyltransferase involved in cell wall biosynthesis
MKVLVVHNHYQQAGGESEVFAAESALLEQRGHDVYRYTMHNDAADKMGRAALAKATIWNKAAYRELRGLIRREQPAVVHFHNTFPLISPAAYHAAHAEGAPVVQTLHNYRLLCDNALLFREGRPCEDCLGKAVPWPGVVHACYRGSRPASGVVAVMLTTHRALGTWTGSVDTYVALTDFARRKFIQGGLPAEKIVVKPNFLYDDPGTGAGRGDYLLFVGRLSREKGIDTLLTAWEHLGEETSLKIVGDGPMAPEVMEAARRCGRIEWLGKQPKERVIDLMKDARMLVFPSEWYEGFPMVIVEAYAVGLPVLASDLGSMSSLISHGRTGLHFRPGDPGDLAMNVAWVAKRPTLLQQMRSEARAAFEAEYTATRNYHALMQIYRTAAEGMKARTSTGPA